MSIQTVLNLLDQCTSILNGNQSTKLVDSERLLLKNKIAECIFIDVGINAHQDMSPYGSGIYFQLEAIRVPRKKISKSHKSDPEISFHTLAQGGHFDHLIQRYRSPSIPNTGSGLLLAFGTRLSLSRLQELFSASLANLPPAVIQQKISMNVVDNSSMPAVLVVSDAEFAGGEYVSLQEGKKGSQSKMPELFSVQTKKEISFHAEIAVVLHVLRSHGLRASDSLHQLQRDVHIINQRMLESIRVENHFAVLHQIASSHGVHFIVSLIHGQEIKNNNTLEPAIRVS